MWNLHSLGGRCSLQNVKIFPSIYVRRTWAFSYVFLYSSFFSSSSFEFAFFLLSMCSSSSTLFGILYLHTENENRAHMIISCIRHNIRWTKKKSAARRWKKEERIRLEICTLFSVKFIMIIFCVEIREYYIESENVRVWVRARESQWFILRVHVNTFKRL